MSTKFEKITSRIECSENYELYYMYWHVSKQTSYIPVVVIPAGLHVEGDGCLAVAEGADISEETSINES